MFSKLVFMIENEEIEFNAYELIIIADGIINDQLKNLASNEIVMPDYQAISERLDKKFWSFTRTVSASLEESYQLKEDKIYQYISFVYKICTEFPFHIPLIFIEPSVKQLLSHIKAREKVEWGEVPIDNHVVIPMQLISMNNIKQWVFIANYLSANYLSQKRLSGWWFEIGGRVVRLRNDVEGGELLESNKQFYSSDHGIKKKILANTKKSIQRCINNFTWHDDGGTWFRAFKFWRFFILSQLQEFKTEFVERVTDEILADQGKCQELYLTLERPVAPPQNLPSFQHLSKEEIAQYQKVFEKTFLNFMRQPFPTSINTEAKIWIKHKFIVDLTADLAGNNDACIQLLGSCFYAYFRRDVTVRYESLPKNIIKKREKAFDKVADFFMKQHQASLREEFIAHLNDEIAASPAMCQLLLFLLSLIPRPTFRGCIDVPKWENINNFALGMRGRISQPEIPPHLGLNLTEEQRRRYSIIFDDLIEQFRYVTQAIVTKRMEFMKNALTPFHTQINQIMHKVDASNYKLAHVLYELAKDISLGKHEPLFREVSAYGDRESGDSYHKFAHAIEAYFALNSSLSEAKLVDKMRSVLKGEDLEDENLNFLPCLTAAWFISESARNSLTSMTSLMLLDLIESNIILDSGDRNNWYCWRNALIHPQKGSSVGRTRDLYGARINLDEFGGCHPMAHQGSVRQTQTLPSVVGPLTVARQKEGHLIIHWLLLRILALNEEEKAKYHLKKVDAKKLTKESKQINNKLDELKKKEKQQRKFQGTIRVKKNKDPSVDISKQEKALKTLDAEIEKLRIHIAADEEKLKLKEKIKMEIIVPLLKKRMSSLNNLLNPMACAQSSRTASKEYSVSQEEEFLEAVKQKSLSLSEKLTNIGARSIEGWTLHEVEDKGNCFYEAVAHQMNLIQHNFLAEIPEGTLAHDSLRLRIQRENFKDREWADIAEIETFVHTFNLAIGIVDTRSPRDGFIYYHIDQDGNFDFINNLNLIPSGKQILRLAYTGNHYLSVIETAEEALARITRASLSSETSFFTKLYENFITENRHYDPKIQRAYDKRFGLMLRK